MGEKYENDDMHIEATELRLGLPGSNEKQSNDHVIRSHKRTLMAEDSGSSTNHSSLEHCPPPSKAQIVGWPPVRSYRKNNLQMKKADVQASVMYVKVSMDGAPYLRKIDLNVYRSYVDLIEGLENMFKVCIGRDSYNGYDYMPTYEDKDGDWMLVGDVPWEMFITSCKRFRIMKSSEAKKINDNNNSQCESYM